MDLSTWKYKNPDEPFLPLENWMKLGIYLSNFVKETKQIVKVYISVPSSLLLSYFCVVGAIDFDFRNLSNESLLQKYLNLERGQRILYKTSSGWTAHSVIEVSSMPNTKTRAIIIKDRLNSISYIPESKWFNNIRIYDDEITRVKNTRRVSNIEHLTDNALLKKLYTEQNLNLLMLQNTPRTFLNANKSEWVENESVVQLKINGEAIQIKDMLFDDTVGTYKNFVFIQQNHRNALSEEGIIISVGSNRALRTIDQFNHQKCIYIIDQHDATEKVEELQLKIEQEFLAKESRSVNQDILKYMHSKQTEIPKGVEIFAWSEKS